MGLGSSWGGAEAKAAFHMARDKCCTLCDPNIRKASVDQLLPWPQAAGHSNRRTQQKHSRGRLSVVFYLGCPFCCVLWEKFSLGLGEGGGAYTRPDRMGRRSSVTYRS